jgi:hypothetical protein
MRLLAMLAAFGLASAAAAEDKDKPAIRTLDLKGVKLKHEGNAPKPTEIASAEELAKAGVFEDAAGRDAIKKQIDFEKEKLVVFAWSGSGGDKLTSSLAADGKKVAFAYRAGLTDDLRHHGFAYAIPRAATVEVLK